MIVPNEMISKADDLVTRCYGNEMIWKADHPEIDDLEWDHLGLDYRSSDFRSSDHPDSIRTQPAPTRPPAAADRPTPGRRVVELPPASVARRG